MVTKAKKATAKSASGRVSAEDFVKTWQASDSVAEVSKALNITVGSAQQRASNYRTQKGIPLKKMTRGGAKLDIETLQALVAQTTETETEPAAEATS